MSEPEDNTTIEWGELADRGFLVGTFTDHNGEKCSIQESSLATEFCIWLGQDDSRMHLTVENVRALLPPLLRA